MIRVLVLLVVLGLVWWLTSFLPLPEPFPTLILIVIILVLIWELLAVAGMVPSPSNRFWPRSP